MANVIRCLVDKLQSMVLRVLVVNAHLCINFVIRVGKKHVPKAGRHFGVLILYWRQTG
jgi:hypothetical protein